MRKLSEIRGEEAMDLISMLVDIGQKVMADKSLAKYLNGKIPKGTGANQFSDEFTGAFFSVLFGKYKKDCIKMLAAIEGVSEEEYLKDSDIMKITSDLGSLTSDRVFFELFFASAQSRIESGSASANTTVRGT